MNSVGHSQGCLHRQCVCTYNYCGHQSRSSNVHKLSANASSMSCHGSRSPQLEYAQKTVKVCGCGGRALLLTSRSEANPGRRFYRCPYWKNKCMTCGLFEWADECDPDEVNKLVLKLMKKVKMLKLVCASLGIVVVGLLLVCISFKG